MVYDKAMRYYPMFVKLQGRRCLVVGAGKVGLRKIRTLLDRGVEQVLVLDLAPEPDSLKKLAQDPRLVFEQRGFDESDVEDRFMVIAATSNGDVNKHVSDVCARNSILCNIIDKPSESSFIVPATVSRGDLTIAISTGGNSPALAKHVRKNLQEIFGDEYAKLLHLLGALRPLMLEMEHPTSVNTDIFRRIVSSNIIQALEDMDWLQVETILKETLPEDLHYAIGELLNGIS